MGLQEQINSVMEAMKNNIQTQSQTMHYASYSVVPNDQWQTLIPRCTKCKKMISTSKTTVRYKVTQNYQIEFLCESCHAAWEEKHEIKDIEFKCNPVNGLVFAKITFKNRDGVLDGLLSTIRNRGDLPPSFHTQFNELFIKWQTEENNKRLASFEVVDTFDKQEIHCRTNGNKSFIIPFKVARDGKTLLDKNVQLPDYVMKQINERLSDAK